MPDKALAEVKLERSSVAVDNAPAVKDDDYATFVSHINTFGLSLGQAMATSNDLTTKNIVYSPLSAALALSMTYAGARGTTAAEMKTVLGDTFPAGTFHVASNRLTRELASRMTSRTDAYGYDYKVELALANTLFAERTLPLASDFLEVLGREYDSGVHQVDFKGAPEPARLSINAWVQEQTRDKIKDLLPPLTISSLTRVVLVNALYFHGSWAASFDPNDTYDGKFNALSGAQVSARMMRSKRTLAYREATDFVVAEIPYEANKLRMTIVLPAAGSFESVRSQLSAAWLADAVKGLSDTQLFVSLPKFELTVGSFSLRAGLEALGMKQAFTPTVADLSGITTAEPLFISDVLQKAYIGVSERETIAAAATAVVVATGSAQQQLPLFYVDRPFLFFIRDESGAVLFSGQVVDPTAP